MSKFDALALGFIFGLIYLELRRIRKLLEKSKQIVKGGSDDHS